MLHTDTDGDSKSLQLKSFYEHKHPLRPLKWTRQTHENTPRHEWGPKGKVQDSDERRT